ncbi:MAG: ATPase, T2SS/T4P/T4SS family, partial [Promethearchaeota archaeon]
PDIIKILPDSSVILSGQLIELLKTGEIFNEPLIKDKKAKGIEIILSKVVIAELENQANQERVVGEIGLNLLLELKKAIDSNDKYRLRVYGTRPSLEQIKLNSGGELDAVIRQHASDNWAILISSDKVQAQLAEVEGIPTIFYEHPKQIKNMGIHLKKRITDYFDDHTMSVHLRNGCKPQAKKGTPGSWKLEYIDNKPLTADDIKDLESAIIEEAQIDPDSFIEKNLRGVTIVQLRNYRIVICRPPFADSHEITAVKPLVKLTLDDYDVTPKMLRRFEKAEGILVAGSPGAGKSTFISALAEFYLKKHKVVKTLESVRDLQVPDEVSQYTELEDDFEKTADILLLIRPDYTIFDEIRTSDNFKIFADMRLAGVGMVGVIHASSAIDAIQRFIRKIELGILASVVDTVIFIEKGEISEVLKLDMTVKVPSGFRDVGLARPVIEVKDYIDNYLLYEIYEFGSNVIVSSVHGNRRRKKKTTQKSKSKKKNKKKDNRNMDYPDATDIEEIMDNPVSYYPDGLPDYNEMIEDNGENIATNSDQKQNQALPKARIDYSLPPNRVDFKIIYAKNSIRLKAGEKFANSTIDVYLDKDFLCTYTIGKTGEIKVSKNDKLYHKIEKAIEEGMDIYGLPKDINA